MNKFQIEIEHIEETLDYLEENCIGEQCTEISKMQIFVQGYLPGILYKMSCKDNSIDIEIKKLHELFISTMDFNGESYFRKNSDIKYAATIINNLFLKMMNCTS